MNWPTVEDTWQQWLRERMAVPCIWAHQDAPAPALPYATLDIINVSALGAYDEISTAAKDHGVQISEIGYRLVTLSVQLDAANSPTSSASSLVRQLLSQAHDALRRQASRMYFRDHHIAVARVGNIAVFGLPHRDTMVARANFDVDFVICSIHSQTVASLGDVSLAGEVIP